MTDSLKGLRVLNTRPQEQAAKLSKNINDIGGISIECPTLEIESTGTEWLTTLPNLSEVDLAIFISPNAVRFFCSALQQNTINWPKTSKILAIGEATANELQHFGLQVDAIPETPDSEHVVSLVSQMKQPNQRILVIKGIGGRTLIEDELKKKGIKVSNLCVYRRGLAQTSQQKLLSLWRDDGVDIILITSEQSLHNLFSLIHADAQSWLQNKTCLVLSERLANAAKLLGVKKIIISRPERMINTLIDYSKGLIHGYENGK